MEPIDLLGYTGGFLIVLSLIPQVIKSWKTKSTKDISLLRYIIYVIGVLLFVVYGVIIRNGPVALINTAAAVLASVILYLKIRHG